MVFKPFESSGKQVEFARFFVLNAKVLDKMEFEVYNHYRSEMLAYQYRLLQVENRASRHARFEFRTTSMPINMSMISQWLNPFRPIHGVGA